MEKIREKLRKELKKLDVLCIRIWAERYKDAKNQDTWYDELWVEYIECRTKIKTYLELLEDGESSKG